MTKPLRFFRFAMLLLLAPGLPACAGGPITVEDQPPSTLPWNEQIIVKFRDPAFEPNQGGYLAKLSRECGVMLSYVRPMSSGAHILRIADGSRGPDADRAVGLLRERDEVLYAERDRPMRTLGEK